MAGRSAIPTRTLILSEPLGERLGGGRVAEEIAAGLLAGGAPAPERCPIEEHVPGARAGELLDELGFSERMLACRALLLAVARLEQATLAGSLAFEAATRARQSGVPCYAVAAVNRLGAFDARILDLQLVIEAQTPTALRRAGKRLAGVI
jgi:glycerate kinase